MKRFVVTRENDIEVKTERKNLTTRDVSNLGDERCEYFFKVVGIFDTKDEAQSFFDSLKAGCNTSAVYRFHRWNITFDEIQLCEITEDILEEYFGGEELKIGDEFSGFDALDVYISPYKNEFFEIEKEKII